MNIAHLLEIGLTSGEAKVYLALLKLGESKTGKLASTAGVSSSKVYKILDRLEKKGLVGHVVKLQTKYFSAIKPRRILDYLKEKEQDLKLKQATALKLIPQLEQEMLLHEPETETFVYEGFRAIKNLFLNILEDLKKGDSYFVLGAGYSEDIPLMKDFFQNFHQQRAKKGIYLRMLANHDMNGFLVPATAFKSDIRFLPDYLISNMQITFYKDTAIVCLWVKHPKSFVIKNKEVVAGFQRYFDLFWKSANL